MSRWFLSPFFFHRVQYTSTGPAAPMRPGHNHGSALSSEVKI
jgi:hypothetical protein